MRDCDVGGACDASELVCRPNAGLEGEEAKDDRAGAPFLIEVDGGTANGEKLKADAVDRIAAAPRNLILCGCVAIKSYQLFICLSRFLGPLKVLQPQIIADN